MARIPKTIVRRIMQQASPQSGKINADSRDAMCDCVAEFAAVLASEAARVGKEESRRIMSGEDVITALARLGLTDYIGPLTLQLHRYRESQGIVSRGSQQHAEQQVPAPAAAMGPVEVQVEVPPRPAAAVVTLEEMLQPRELDLTLGLALPAQRIVTELGLRENVYKAWPGAGGAMPPVGDDP